MNLFLTERIYEKLIPFQSSIKKNKFKSFRDATERKQNPSKLTGKILEL